MSKVVSNFGHLHIVIETPDRQAFDIYRSLSEVFSQGGIPALSKAVYTKNLESFVTLKSLDADPG